MRNRMFRQFVGSLAPGGAKPSDVIRKAYRRRKKGLIEQRAEHTKKAVEEFRKS